MAEATPNIGELRHRVTVEVRAAGTPNGFGDVTPEDWRALIRLPAKVEQVSAVEIPINLQTRAVRTYRVTIRYFSTLTEEHRLRWDGRILNIDGIVELGGKREWMLVTCREG